MTTNESNPRAALIRSLSCTAHKSVGSQRDSRVSVKRKTTSCFWICARALETIRNESQCACGKRDTRQFVEFRGIFARRFHLARSRKAVSGHRNGHLVPTRLHTWKHATQCVSGRGGLCFAAIQAVGEFKERLVDGGFGQGRVADAGSAIEGTLRARLLLTCRTGLEYETRPLSTSDVTNSPAKEAPGNIAPKRTCLRAPHKRERARASFDEARAKWNWAHRRRGEDTWRQKAIGAERWQQPPTHQLQVEVHRGLGESSRVHLAKVRLRGQTNTSASRARRRTMILMRPHLRGPFLPLRFGPTQ